MEHQKQLGDSEYVAIASGLRQILSTMSGVGGPIFAVLNTDMCNPRSLAENGLDEGLVYIVCWLPADTKADIPLTDICRIIVEGHLSLLGYNALQTKATITENILGRQLPWAKASTISQYLLEDPSSFDKIRVDVRTICEEIISVYYSRDSDEFRSRLRD
jgi:hypothetical protein